MALNSITMWSHLLFIGILLNFSMAVLHIAEDSSPSNDFQMDMSDLLGLSELSGRFRRQPSLRNSASQFLLKVYHEIKEDDNDKVPRKGRPKRALLEDNFITPFDRQEIARCNNIITFSSKVSKTPFNAHIDHRINMLINFNVNDVPLDVDLVQSALRIYQQPSLGTFTPSNNKFTRNITISLYSRLVSRRQQLLTGKSYRFINAINSTTDYQGWLEFNVTQLLAKWLNYKTLQQVVYGNDLLLTAHLGNDIIPTADVGLIGVTTAQQLLDLQPFIIGYFNGPDWLARMQKIRYQREVLKRPRRKARYPPPPVVMRAYKWPKTCERLNFTLDFKDLNMHKSVIAPKKFEAYFCGGECDFPAAGRLNATNHAIVQTLMHLKQPHLPKPCCVPIKLGSISILHYLNEDSVNLSKYPQSVAEECGCH